MPIKNEQLTATRLVLLLLLTGLTACSTGRGTGALAGAGVGALIGQAAGGDTKATLIGAAVGTGVGYLIGDQVDKKKAAQMSTQSDTHSEVGQLGGTRWRLASINTQHTIEPYASKIIEFTPDGRVITTTTQLDGSVLRYDESYRVVGDVLIINKPGYLVNARYRRDGNSLIVNDAGFSAVLERI